jgi:hypothetical protein
MFKKEKREKQMGKKKQKREREKKKGKNEGKQEGRQERKKVIKRRYSIKKKMMKWRLAIAKFSAERLELEFE